jgi:hypothetical protein
MKGDLAADALPQEELDQLFTGVRRTLERLWD